MTRELLEHPLSFSVDIAAAFLALSGGSPNALWFDDHGERGRGMSYLAVGTPVAGLNQSWREALRSAHRAAALSSAQSLQGLPLGVVLVAPYELGVDTMALSTMAQLPAASPESRLHALVVERLVAIEHDTQRATLWALGPGWEGELAQWRDDLSALLANLSPLAPPELPHRPELVWRDSTSRYRDMIALAQEAIREGEAYQLCLTTQVRIEAPVDAIALHRVIRATNPTHHQALIRLEGLDLVCASPETFLDVGPTGEVITRPIKGTRPRGASAHEDQMLARELLESDKERAENLMIVDLMRNDLSVVCDTGSVAVPELMVVESYASVHQLVSTVTGQLAKGTDVLDLLDATFPAGSMTGAPKRRAVDLLGSWESAPRGLYSGTVGVWRADGSATLAMTIRTAIIGAEGLTIGVGGGITSSSEASSEIAEVGIKAMPFLRALGHDEVQYS